MPKIKHAEMLKLTLLKIEELQQKDKQKIGGEKSIGQFLTPPTPATLPKKAA